MTALADGPDAPTPSDPSDHPEQTAGNRLEEGIASVLVDEFVEALTDRSGGDHPAPWSPEQRVRVGVLGFTVTPPAPTDGTTTDEGEGTDDGGGPATAPATLPEQRPIDNTSVIGLDFVVDPDADRILLTCDVRYAMYQQLWPDYAEVATEARQSVAAAAAHGPDASASTAVTGMAGESEGEDHSEADGMSGASEGADAAGSENVDRASDPVPAGGSGGASSATSGRPAKKRARRPNVRIRPTWRRYDRHQTIELELTGWEQDDVIVSSRSMPGGDPLVADAQQAVSDHYSLPDAARKLARSQTLPASEVAGGEANYKASLASHLDPRWTPQWPLPEIKVIAVPTEDGQLAVSVSLVNSTDLPERPFQDLALYDAKLDVEISAGATLDWKRLLFAEDDPRYNEAATVPGRGRFCVACGDHRRPNTIWSETLPLYRQPHVRPADIPGADVTFAALERDPVPTLNAIAVAMGAFERNWVSPPPPADNPNFFIDLRRQFGEERDRFQLGCDLLYGPRRDPELARAFALANAAFARANPGPDAGWRLFQLVFIVSELGALAVRRNPSDPLLKRELEAVDVLWFPTGGGKTEAYLGLIATALFYDRLRGKHRGPTAWLLFPLRMLSVQQLARMVRVLYFAEQLRSDPTQAIPGDQFSLGYLAGSNNTPNRLAPKASNGWWPGLSRFATLSNEERDLRRLVGACPACNNDNSVGLDVDIPGQRLLHVCRSCDHVLAIHASDEEVTRYLSSVIISTVDKTANSAYFGEFTSFHRGPKHQCAAHGYYSFGRCPVEGCTATQGPPAGAFVDVTPSLWIQDELHLVREELGVFASHYHTLQAELARGAGNLPSKVLAATATIEQYEDQLRQVYGRRPRMFPTGGPTRHGSFYTTVTDDTRRFYLGVLPSGGGTAKVDLAGQLQVQLIRSVHYHTNDPTPLVKALAARGVTATPDEVRQALFDYELALGYVNSKAHGVHILDDVQTLSADLVHSGEHGIVAAFLSGETPLGELARVVAAITGAKPGVPPRNERYRGLVGTSVVSHGVDLERLNLQVVAGMPPSYAHYIQATSRAGRTHVGLVVSIFDRFNRRETSVFHSFLVAHEALERMVEPVPVNRFAARAVDRTLPGIVCSLLWDEAYMDAAAPAEGIGLTRRFKPWWSGVAATLKPRLTARIRQSYTSPVPGVNPPQAERKLADDAEQRWELECQRMQMFGSDWLTELFTSPAMTSLRDVQSPVEFGGGARAEQVIEHLLGNAGGAPPAPATTSPTTKPAKA